jgi:hypothetical protein
MSIDPDGVYGAVTFYYIPDNIVWTVQGPLSGDLVAGILTGILVVTQYLAANRGINPDNITVEVFAETRIVGTSEKILEQYQLASGADAIPEQLPDDNFGWWLYHSRERLYYLYTFRTPEFTQGFISIMQGFGLDFRHLVIGPPYKFPPEAKEPIFYTVPGYDVEPFPEPKRGAPVGAFYTAGYEADPGGEDYE